jgi:hypothetical protein
MRHFGARRKTGKKGQSVNWREDSSSGGERELRGERATVSEGRARGKEECTVHSRWLQGPRRGLGDRCHRRQSACEWRFLLLTNT